MKEPKLGQRNIETVVMNGQTFTIEYVPKNALGSYFGMAYNASNHAVVRDDLSPLVKRFVKAHELYHLQDEKPGGWLRCELRANFYPGLKDPLGLLATIIASLNAERLSLYAKMLFMNR